MDFGLTLMMGGPASDLEVIRRLAQLAEESRLGAIWVGDHIVFPAEMPSTYPYSSSGRYLQDADGGWLDPLIVLSELAATTTVPRLGLGVLVVPYRNPIVMTKMVTTLDVLSEGRAILGAGVGWLEEEFVALGADYGARGLVTDEYLEIYEGLCDSARPQYNGKTYQLPEVVFEPKPVQRPWPPIWIGGNSGPALHRAARFAAVWQPVALLPDQVQAATSRLADACEKAGRNDLPGLSVRCFFHITDGCPDVPGAGGTAVVGSADHVLDVMEQYRSVGIDHLAFTPLNRSCAEEYESQTRRFLEDVVSRMGR